MRIQEMKSGLVHLKKKAGEERRDVFYGVAAARAIAETPESEGLSVVAGCELDEPRWSVVSFERKEAAGLTYEQATRLMRELDSRRVTGLCLVTDETAARVG